MEPQDNLTGPDSSDSKYSQFNEALEKLVTSPAYASFEGLYDIPGLRIDILLLFSGIQSALSRLQSKVSDSSSRRDPVAPWKTLLSTIQYLYDNSADTNTSTTGEPPLYHIIFEDGCYYITNKINGTPRDGEMGTKRKFDSSVQTRCIRLNATSRPHNGRPEILFDYCEEVDLSYSNHTALIEMEDSSVSTTSLTVSTLQSVYLALSRTFSTTGTSGVSSNLREECTPTHCCALAVSGPLYAPNGITAKFKSKKWGPRFFIPCDFTGVAPPRPINRIASWICGSLVFGDVMVMDMSVDRLADLVYSDLCDIFRGSFPNQLWSYNNQFSNFLHTLPSSYVPQMCSIVSPIAVKKPIALLREIVMRRTGGASIVITKSICRLRVTQFGLPDIPPSLEEEIIPPLTWCPEIGRQYLRDRPAKFVDKIPVAHFIPLNVVYCNLIEIKLPDSPEYLRDNSCNSLALMDVSGLSARAISPRSFSEHIPVDNDPTLIHYSDVDLLQENCSIQMFEDVDSSENSLALEILRILQMSAEHFVFDKKSLPSFNNCSDRGHHPVAPTSPSSSPSSSSFSSFGRNGLSTLSLAVFDNQRNLLFHRNKIPCIFGVGMLPSILEATAQESLSSLDIFRTAELESSLSDLEEDIGASVAPTQSLNLSQTEILEVTASIQLLPQNSSFLDPVTQFAVCGHGIAFDESVVLLAAATKADTLVAEVTLHDYSKFKSSAMKASRRLFHPSLAEQRRRMVASLIKATDAQTWLDVGCGDGSFLSGCLQESRQFCVHNLTAIAGLDISQKLADAKVSLETLLQPGPLVPQSEVNCNLTLSRAELWCASILDIDVCKQLGSQGFYDFVSCIEVIEHLPSIEDASQAVYNILTHISPACTVLSTPNYEANRVIRQNCISPFDLLLQMYKKPNLCDSLSTGTTKPENFREADHKFEFTRHEFKLWIEKILEQVSIDSTIRYELDIIELGTNLPGMDATGGATQVAVIRQHNLKRSPEISLPVSPVDASSDGHVECYWSWKRSTETP